MINQEIVKGLSTKLGTKIQNINAVVEMLQNGDTIPFIARYRKEKTDALDEEQIREIDKEYQYLVNLTKKKEDVLRLIEEKGKLTSEIKNQVNIAAKLSELEDIYRPYKEKKKTRAGVAIKLGLEPLAKTLIKFEIKIDVLFEAKKYINDEVKNEKAALKGAMDIIAEYISDNAKFRKWIKYNYSNNAKIKCTKKKKAVDELGKFQDYYEAEEMIKYIKPHRVLAMNRGEKEKIIGVSISEDKEYVFAYLKKQYIKNENSPCTPYVIEAMADSYKRLIKPSIEREVRSEITTIAEDYSIDVFSVNLKNLLLQPPMKNFKVLGVDPAFRTGCKLAVVDETSKLQFIDVIYPNEMSKNSKVDPRKLHAAKKTIKDAVEKYNINLIAIGNGTASRETESFIVDVISTMDKKVPYLIVSEAGASVYSASKQAIKEFPDLKVEERSAVSIARRIQDPLSELVKIDPKSIGVGQYQHDINQKNLTESLDFVVETTVNQVGVDLNTASGALLSYVSGISSTIATNIVNHRDEIGVFKSRVDLKKVKKLGPKAFEQCAGFLRILEGKNKLDETLIHPESYKETKLILSTLSLTLKDIGTSKLKEKINNTNRLELQELTNLGMHTLNDILDSLIAPRRDPRDDVAKPLLRTDILKLEDIKVGDLLEGTVRNVTAFGAFVDCGLKNDGLVHKSKMAERYIENPMDIVSIGDIIKIYVIDVDLVRKRLSLSIVKPK